MYNSVADYARAYRHQFTTPSAVIAAVLKGIQNLSELRAFVQLDEGRINGAIAGISDVVW